MIHICGPSYPECWVGGWLKSKSSRSLPQKQNKTKKPYKQGCVFSIFCGDQIPGSHWISRDRKSLAVFWGFFAVWLCSASITGGSILPFLQANNLGVILDSSHTSSNPHATPTIPPYKAYLISAALHRLFPPWAWWTRVPARIVATNSSWLSYPLPRSPQPVLNTAAGSTCEDLSQITSELIPFHWLHLSWWRSWCPFRCRRLCHVCLPPLQLASVLYYSPLLLCCSRGDHCASSYIRNLSRLEVHWRQDSCSFCSVMYAQYLKQCLLWSKCSTVYVESTAPENRYAKAVAVNLQHAAGGSSDHWKCQKVLHHCLR